MISVLGTKVWLIITKVDVGHPWESFDDLSTHFQWQWATGAARTNERVKCQQDSWSNTETLRWTENFRIVDVIALTLISYIDIYFPMLYLSHDLSSHDLSS